MIGRTGKGTTAGIAFDLDQPMGESACVQCGECMVSCPTSAITYRPVAQVKVTANGTRRRRSGAPRRGAARGGADRRPAVRRRAAEVPALAAGPCRPAARPARRSALPPGRAGQHRVPHQARPARGHRPPVGRAAKELRFEKRPGRRDPRRDGVPQRHAADGGRDRARRRRSVGGPPQRARPAHALADPARAVRVALPRPRAQRGPARRRPVPRAARGRVRRVSSSSSGPRLSFVRVNPGQTIFRQGDWADDLYLVRLGHVRVDIDRPGRDETVLYRGPGHGASARSACSRCRRTTSTASRRRGRRAAIADGARRPVPCRRASDRRPARRWTTSSWPASRAPTSSRWSALFPTVRSRLVKMSLDRLRGDGDDDSPLRPPVRRPGPVPGPQPARARPEQVHALRRVRPRLRRPARHGVPRPADHAAAPRRRCASATTSSPPPAGRCKDAYCMVGCPVDAIHRGKHLQIVIEDHCIGCGLCATNCPYGNISMVPNLPGRADAPSPRRRRATSATPTATGRAAAAVRLRLPARRGAPDDGGSVAEEASSARHAC